MSIRITEASNNGVQKKPSVTRKTTPKRAKKGHKRPPNKDLRLWSIAGVTILSGGSAALNGYANSLHATIPIAGWLLGLSIPLIVIILARIAGLQYRRKRLAHARLTAISGIGLLALSVWHCSQSIALLTSGEVNFGSMILAFPMAIAIDCGLVACEIALLDAS